MLKVFCFCFCFFLSFPSWLLHNVRNSSEIFYSCQISALLNVFAKNEKNYVLEKKIVFTTSHFCMWQFHFPKTKTNKSKQWTHYPAFQVVLAFSWRFIKSAQKCILSSVYLPPPPTLLKLNLGNYLLYNRFCNLHVLLLELCLCLMIMISHIHQLPVYFIPLWEWTWCHCLFYVRQDRNARPDVSLQENTCATTKKDAVEMLTHMYKVTSILGVG